MATRSRYCSFTVKEKLRIIEEAENIGDHAAGRKYDVRLAQKTNCDLQRRIVIVGNFAARKQGIRSLKKDYAIMWMIKDNMDSQLLVKCAN